MYDHYDRSGPKIYVGEYACKQDAGGGNLKATLAEAAFMTGMERNSDLVLMASYAPLFVNPQWKEWNPNLIVFDSSKVYGTPSYYNQLLFANNRPDVILPLSLDIPAETPAAPRPALYAVAGQKNDSGEIILKVVNITGQAQQSMLQLDGAADNLNAHATVLASDNPNDENSFTQPTKIAPKDSVIEPVSSSFAYTFPPYSVTVLHLTKNP